jgi:inosine-uridine nucleoside N-ribohydrolase/ADP-ribosylglycohydrolase
MHNVLDLRDTVPDEAEQKLHSGYDIGSLLDDARSAAAANDLVRLRDIAVALSRCQRVPGWTFSEPSDDATLLSVINALPALSVDSANLANRIHGAWLGRCVGNTMGKPIEGLTRSEVEIYLRAVGQWPQTGYVPLLGELPEGVSHLHESAPFASAGLFETVPRDDDIDWTILGLHLIETYGDAFTTSDIATEWLDRIPFTQTFTAERAAYRNLLRGVSPLQAAVEDNPYREWIGALIRGDIFGFVNPGNPAAAATLALRDARLTHTENGIYGELWAAALVSSAFAANDATRALEIALQSVPGTSRLAQSQRQILDLCKDGKSAAEALAWVDENLGHYNWVHTVNNAALIAIGLLWGTDFTTSVALTISGARDTDSNAATVGSVFGALHGKGSIPADLVGTTHVRVSSAIRGFDGIAISDLAARTLQVAKVPSAAPKNQKRAIPVIIDTDPGLGEPGSDIDDGFAIALALRSPELDVIGLTIVNGNVSMETGTDVARRLCDRLDRPDLPVVSGAARPMRRGMEPVHAMFEAVYDNNPAMRRPPRRTEGLLKSNRAEGAAAFLVAEAARHAGELVVIAIGPMTNIAEAIQLDPAFAGNVKEFVVMAGSATTYAHNITPVGDFNVYVDPEAMDVLLRSGAKIRMVGIDQTSQCVLTRDDAAMLSASGDEFSDFAAQCSEAWIDYLHKAFPRRPEHRAGCFLHDPLVVAAVVDPLVCTWDDANAEVDTASELARGLVVTDRNLALKPAAPFNATVAIKTDVARFRRLFLERIRTAPQAT